jgi:hypothetical protein
MSFAKELEIAAAPTGFRRFLTKLAGLALLGTTHWGLLVASTALEHERFPVAGEVSVDGQPATGAQVRLYRLHDEPELARAVAWGTVKDDGRFSLKTLGWAEGAPVGKYAVTVAYEPPVIHGEDFLPGEHVLAESLADPRTTSLAVEVLAEPNHLGVLELKTPQARLELARDSRWLLSQTSLSGELP